ncbi:hypothetical protein ACFWBR_35065 [Streptomyces sp. NPDC060006]|uniref:hypothetical protein n=1 Tax=unclassified Streptomyces TaxID=2593676 RepID=UPI0036CD9ABC
MAVPQPMPHPNDDPDTLAARASKQTFTEKAKDARENLNASDLFVAEKIAALYETHKTEVREAWDSISERRRDRLDYLETLVPVGPGIPKGTSGADKALLMQAFRAAYEKAKEATPRVRAELLNEAERFDDDAMRRAVLTTALDNSELNLIGQWTSVHTDHKDYLDEVRDLREALANWGQSHLWDMQDFNPLPTPHEVSELPRLQAAAEVERAARRERASRRTF